ncbi:hypothetical protein KIN20_014305 [Parelaphostrongylus tenuis]|uniref:Uncharacterized protein n=1 Tax=Parelaphostrongylus tenuis TaxID=148309 RepID=A0AAD5QPB1_PARTN|nr:hypothetical protein KIN20_014305 [Parelaphostrongylus tenuis]
MNVEDLELRAESSFSLQSIDDASSVLYDNESPEAFNDSGDILLSKKMSTVVSVHNLKVVREVAQEMMWDHR